VPFSASDCQAATKPVRARFAEFVTHELLRTPL
jgi:hypothetical protein